MKAFRLTIISFLQQPYLYSYPARMMWYLWMTLLKSDWKVDQGLTILQYPRWYWVLLLMSQVIPL